jgi:hypothetical protein
MSEGYETSLIILKKSEIPQAVWHKDKCQIGALSSAAAYLVTLSACINKSGVFARDANADIPRKAYEL